MSSRVAEDIPLETHSQHPIAPNGPPPPYSSPKALPGTKWYKRRLVLIILSILLAIIIIIAAVLGKVLSDRNKNSSTAKIFGLAATECEAGTFVVWKLASGDFWWKGVLNNGKGIIPPQQVNQAWSGLKYTQPGFVDLTASCYFNNPESSEVMFQFIYYDPQVFRTFIWTKTVINLPSMERDGSVVPTIDMPTTSGFGGSKFEYDITSLGVTAVTPSDNYRYYINRLVYLVPRNLSEPDGPANVVYKASLFSSDWLLPRILNGTAIDAKASIAIASVDGGVYNSNVTSVHVIFVGEQSRLMYLNWTDSGDWSSAIPIYTNSGEHYQLSNQKFTLAISSTSQNHSIYDSPLNVQEFTIPPPTAAQRNISKNYYDPPAPGSIRLNLYWLSSSSSPTSSSNPTNITTLSIAYDSTTNTMRTVGGYDLELGGSNNTTSSVTNPLAYPVYLAAAAYNPSILQNNSQASSGQMGNNRTAENTWNERVQLFFVETDEAASQGGKIANVTFQKTDVGGNAWSWRVGDVVVADVETF